MAGPTPAVADVRRAVRFGLTGGTTPVLVACSGGADSLALAAAVAFEAPRAGVPAGGLTVDHGLHPGPAAGRGAPAAGGRARWWRRPRPGPHRGAAPRRPGGPRRPGRRAAPAAVRGRRARRARRGRAPAGAAHPGAARLAAGRR